MDGGRQGREAAVRTFLIADIRGYTRFTGQYGDEAASRLAMRFAAIAGEGVTAWDGELVELRGDEALAVFSSARQALRAAVELQAAFAAATAEDPSSPMTVGIGLDAGEAVPVTDGYRGAALNMAARLCSVASAGTVLATLGLVRLAGPVPGLVVGDPEPTTFKGVEAPVEVVRITPSTPQPATHTAGAGSRPPVALPPELEPLVPLIGRDADLRRLRWHWRRAAAGDGRVVILSGAPGIGKTRLAAELAGEIAAAGLGVVYLPAGRPIPAAAEAPATDEPALVVADDVDAAGPAIVELAMRLAEATPGTRRLVLLIHRREAPGPLVARLELLAPREQRMTLGPLDADSVRAIVALYAGPAASDAPVGELTAESGGVPASIHRMAGSWARTSATRRLGTSADRAATERRGLRAAEAALMSDMSDLELARERERLYVGDPTIDPVPDGPVICPYKGLAEFEAADSEFYFGRDRLIGELIARFVGGSFLGLVGDSGSGKSSALRAGLLPSLAGGVLPGSADWPQLIMRPGDRPTAALQRALARLPGATDAATPVDALAAALDRLSPGQRLVLVVDQFEEVFNATRDDAERSAFLDLLTTERPGLKVIVSMRADHYGRCAAYPALARLMGTDQVLVGPLTSAEIAAVIEHPAQRAGLRVEPALTAALVADAGTEPGVLPLLSTALLELWQARDGSRLTLAAYRASGGLHGAIARLAESTWAGLDAHRRAVARAILLRLAGPGEGSGLVRRRVALDELDADRDPAVGDVLRTLTGARLLTAGDGHVEVAHEALLREWPRLQEWLAEDSAGREVRLHLMAAAQDWEASGRDPGDLYRGARLATALEWSADHALELNERERAFLDAGRRVSEQDLERQRRTNRRLRGLLVGTAGLLVVALVAGGLAFAQGQRAEQEAARAAQQAELAATEAARATEEQGRAEAAAARADEQRALADAAATTARSRELLASAVAARDRDPALAKLLALQATSLEEQPTFDSMTALHDVLSADPVTSEIAWPAERKVGGGRGTLSPDGTTVAATVYAEGRPDTLELIGVPGREIRWTLEAPLEGEQRPLFDTAWFTSDGAHLVIGAFWDDPEVRLGGEGLGVLVIDAATGRIERTIGLGPCGGLVSGVSGRRALVWKPQPSPAGGCDWRWQEGAAHLVLEVVDLDSGIRRVLSDDAAMNSGGAIAADGRIAAWDTVDAAGDIVTQVVDVESARVRFRVGAPDIPLIQAMPGVQAISRDGSILVYGDRPSLVFDLGTTNDGSRFTKVQSLGGEGSGFVFDPSGTSILGAARDGVLRRWAVPSGLQTDAWPAVGGGEVTISSDGRTALIADESQGLVMRVVRVDGDVRGDLGGVQTCDGFTVGGSLRAAGGTAAFLQGCDFSVPLSGQAQILDLATLRLERTVPNTGIQALAVAPDGSMIAAQRLYSQVEHGPLVILDASTGAVVRELEGLCSWDGRTDRTAAPCAPFPATPFAIWGGDIKWSPDGRWIAAIDGWQGHGAVWEAATGRLAFALPEPDPLDDPDSGPQSWVKAVFTPDSSALLVSQWGNGRITRFETGGWQRTQQVTVTDAAGSAITPLLVGYDADGRLITSDGRFRQALTSLYWLDAASLGIVRTVERVHLGSLKSVTISPDGRMLATGASDGLVRAWDTATGELQQEAHLGAQVQGLTFIDDHRLLAAPDGGDLVVIELDAARLRALVRSTLRRGLTATECATYRIEPCPTLEEMREADPAG